MPPLCWLRWAALFVTLPALASTSGVDWYSDVTLVLLPLLIVALTIYIWLLRKNALLKVKASSLQRFMQLSDDLVAVLDNELKPSYINPALNALLEVPDADPAITELNLYLDEHSNKRLLPNLSLQDNWSGEAWMQTGISDRRIALSATITVLEKKPDTYLLLARDISARKQLEQETAQSYARDSETGLLSPQLLAEYLHSFIQFTSSSHPKFALMLVKFNPLLAADTTRPKPLLKNITTELSSKLQQMVTKVAIVARFNIDTFAVLIPPHLYVGTFETDLNRLGHKLLTLPGQLPPLNSNPSLQTSIGCSIYPLDGKNAAELIFTASNALQGAARMGNSNFLFANANIQQRAPDMLTLETELQKAVAQGEFDVYYQPRVSISSNRVIGYEALLRWHNPKRGILQPDHFLHAADETGLIIQLDQLIFKKCCEQLKHWQQTGINRGRISLNIANLSFCQPDFISSLQQNLDRMGLDAEQFELELHEDILLNADENTRLTLQHLTKLGFHLTLDNFGAGVSSLSVLRKFPFHSLKIAPDFIKDMEHNEQQRNITASLIRMASYLHLDVIATGIENEMQAYLLHVMGCDILQGHLFSKPLPAAEIPALLAKENKLIRKEVG